MLEDHLKFFLVQHLSFFKDSDQHVICLCSSKDGCTLKQLYRQATFKFNL
ncbi:hypothetical protein Syun_030704 [Stephania yunnanensis]|uniref:Uncharacterized protein n=1 Tax=Stephania yunnanensis TaxID=152371 RepID=A0AAP0E1A9_9MAGN